MEGQQTYIYGTIYDIKQDDNAIYVQVRDANGYVIGAGYETDSKIISKKGSWLKIGRPLSYIMQNGFPKKGDIVKVEYTSKPSNGICYLISKNEQLNQVKKANKKGYDTIIAS